MDSLTQATLGAAVGALIGGRKYGRKAAIIGAICGTIPDLDVFVPMGDPVSNFTYHRGVSHSILFCLLATPLLSWVFVKLKWIQEKGRNKRLNLMVFMILFTHILLDAMTIYGTQLFWPLPIPPIGIGSIFIIDFIYTFPLLIGVLCFYWDKRLKANKVGLIISTLYLAWSFGAQMMVTNYVEKQIDTPYKKVLVQPTPFNTMLWRVLVMEEAGYKVGYTSLFDKNRQVNFKTYDSDATLIQPIKDSFAVSRLQWFTKGFYGVRREGDKIIISDLRMGLEPDQYVFQFVVGEFGSAGDAVAVPNRSYAVKRDLGRLSKVWQRIWDEAVQF